MSDPNPRISGYGYNCYLCDRGVFSKVELDTSEPILCKRCACDQAVDVLLATLTPSGPAPIGLDPDSDPVVREFTRYIDGVLTMTFDKTRICTAKLADLPDLVSLLADS